jgi:hypothetical protein
MSKVGVTVGEPEAVGDWVGVAEGPGGVSVAVGVMVGVDVGDAVAVTV